MASNFQEMTRMHRDILREKRALFIENMEPPKLITYLSSTLDETDDEEIKAQPTRRKACEKLLEILPRKGQNAFDKFVIALKEVETQYYLAVALIEAENKKLREQNHDNTKLSQTQDPESEGNKVCNGGRYVSCQSKILVDGSISLRVDVKTNPNSSEISNDPRVPVEQDKLKEPCVGQIEELQVMDNLGVQPTTTFQDSATSRRKATDLVGKDESCSRCKSARSEIQTLKNRHNEELKNRLKTVTEASEQKTQTLQRKYENLEQEGRKLSQKLEAAKKKHQELQRKNKELTNQITKIKSEREEELEYYKKIEAESKAKDNLLQQKDKKLNSEKSRNDYLSRKVETLKEMPGRIYNYSKDFDKNGVVFALAPNSGRTSRVSSRSASASRTQIVATRSSDGEGNAMDLLENQVQAGTLSGTKDEEDSWWCVDLTEKYVLYLTSYTLRHGRDKSLLVLFNWRLEGSVDGREWTVLKNHEKDRGLRELKPYCTCTWTIDGNSNAFRYFRIFQTGMNSSKKFGIFLSGIELYGVLIEKGS